MDPGLDGVVLCRQTEGVPADRKKNVVPLHSPEAGDRVEAAVASAMTDVQAFAGRIGKLDQDVAFFLL